MIKIVAISKPRRTVYFPLDKFVFEFSEASNNNYTDLSITSDGARAAQHLIVEPIDVARDIFEEFIENDKALLLFEEAEL